MASPVSAPTPSSPDSDVRCKIADLIADLPDTECNALRCQAYAYPDAPDADIVICEAQYRTQLYPPNLSRAELSYAEDAFQFYVRLVDFGGFYLHASAVVLDGKAYLFSGRSGVGKSTHTRLWQSTFGSGVRVINDDKPALRLIDGVWYAYGTPWCGKDGIHLNERAPIAGLCFMKQSSRNEIRRIGIQEAVQLVMAQTLYTFREIGRIDAFLKLLEHFLQTIPVYELENRPETEAAYLSFHTMHRAAEEAGL